MPAVIIKGPAGSGKTRNATALARHYRKARVVDEWRQGDPLPSDALVLTAEDVPGAININAALKAAGLKRTA